MNKKRFPLYPAILLAVLAACAYPVYMGVSTLLSFLKSGAVDVSKYPRYVIPYAPLAAALITAIALMPLFMRRFKRYALPLLSLAGTAVFFLCELKLERMQVTEAASAMPLESWQYSLCVSTPEVLRAIGEPIYAQNNPAFKLHFYFISLVILLSVTHTAHGFMKMRWEEDYKKKKPLIMQLAAVAAFTGLCVLACFTAFFRNGTVNVPPLSAFLMAVFFLLFGITCGTYAGCLLHGKRGLLSLAVPALVATAATLLMYLGELVLMDGKLFTYGQGFLFEPLFGMPFAPADWAVILLSGALTYLLMRLMNKPCRLPAQPKSTPG